MCGSIWVRKIITIEISITIAATNIIFSIGVSPANWASSSWDHGMNNDKMSAFSILTINTTHNQEMRFLRLYFWKFIWVSMKSKNALYLLYKGLQVVLKSSSLLPQLYYSGLLPRILDFKKTSSSRAGFFYICLNLTSNGWDNQKLFAQLSTLKQYELVNLWKVYIHFFNDKKLQALKKEQQQFYRLSLPSG